MSKKVSPAAIPAVALLTACIGLSGCGGENAPQPASTAAPAATPPMTTSTPDAPENRWIISMLGGGKIAHMRTALIKLDSNPANPEVAWREEVEYHMSVERFSQTAEPGIEYSGELNADGDLLSFDCVMRLGKIPTTVHGELHEGVLEITETSDVSKRSRELNCPPGTGGFLAVEFSLRQEPMQPGETRALVHYDAVTGGLAKELLAAQSVENCDILDENKQLLRIEQKTQLEGNLSVAQFLWSDAKGEVHKSRSLNNGTEQYLTTREKALAPGPTVDLAWATSVKLSQPLPHAHETFLVRYRVQLTSGDPAQVFPSTGGQIVLPIDEHTAELIVKAVRPIIGSGPVPTSGEPPGAADLQPNAWVQADDERIVRMAKSIAADQFDSWAVARALEKLVHDKMQSRNFNTAMASAAEVCQTLEGDCTEHAVLLAALLRAREIPARVAIGLVYTDTLGGFGFHMWNEAYVHGAWIPLDATLGRGGIGGAHIKLNTTNLAGAGGLTSLLPVAQVMGKLSLDVVHVE